MVRLPNFFIIGAPKCGTTSLAAWLAEHPNVYMSPIKELLYFSTDIGNRWPYGWDAYLRLFEKAGAEHWAIGEASTTYLFSRVAVPAIEEKLPESRYIVMVRNPVDMAYALHEQQLRSFNEDVKDFYTAWMLSAERRAGKRVPAGSRDPRLLDYPSWCRLGEQLERLYAIVPQERVLVLVLDDVKADPQREYLRVLEFLGLPDDGRRAFPVYNPAGEWRRRWLGKAIRVLARRVTWAKYVVGILPKRSVGIVRRLKEANMRQRPRPPLPIEVRMELEQYFAEDIRLLERLLGRDLSAWKHAQVVGVSRA